MDTHRKGRVGEDAAVEHLLSQGYSLLCRNYRCGRGEIDCVAEDPSGTLVFVEVKCAFGGSCGHPAHWVTRSKQRQLAAMARRYLAEHGGMNRVCRFDVVTVRGGSVEHYRNAFMAS